MNEEAKKFITAVGAMAEFMRLMRDEFMKNGFTRKEAISLVQAYMLETFNPNKNKEDT